MSNYVCFLHADRTYTVRKVRKFPTVYNYSGKDYILDPQNIHIRETLFGLKRYVFYQENRLTPLPDVPGDDKIQSLITAIERDHTVAEFLHEFRQNLAMLIFVFAFGAIMGVAIGIIVAPHVLGLK